MSPWPWDVRVAYSPLAEQVQDLGLVAALLASVALTAAVALRWSPPGRGAGRIAALGIVVLAIAAGAWNWPIADDWGVATANRQLGPGSVAAAYLGWTGRYATYCLEAPYGWLLSPVLGSVLWSWTLLGAIVAAAAWAVAGILPPSPLRWRLALTVALAGTATWIVIQIWPGHGLYWFCATTTYAVGLPCLLAMLGVAARAGRWPPTAVAAAMLVLGAVIGGIGESMPVAILPVAAVLAARAWRRRLPARWAWTCAAAALAIGLAANAASPGTAARQHAISDGAEQAIGGSVHLAPAAMLATWAGRSLADAWAWLAHPIVVCAGLAAIPVGILVGRTAGWDRARGPGEAIGAWILVLAVVPAGYLPSYIVFGHVPPWRVRDALQGLLLILAAIAWFRTLAACRVARIDPRRAALAAATTVATAGTAVLLLSPLGPALRCTLAATACLAFAAGLAWWRRALPAAGAAWLLAGALVVGGSLPVLAVDAAWAGPRWRAQHAVAAEVAATGAPGLVRFPRIEPDDRPQHLWYWLPGSDPGHWINRGMAAWYRCSGVGIWPE